MKRSTYVSAALVAATLGGIAAAVPSTAAAVPPTVAAPSLQAPTTPAPPARGMIVGLGDSFMSGEGGRLQGNTYDKLKADGVYDSGKQDRGWGTYEDSFGTPLSGNFKKSNSSAACHRSDTSIVNTVAQAMRWRGINLACSGAVTKQVTDEGFRGEAPQVERLAKLARSKDTVIKAVTISIGGNDMGFSDVLKSCMQVVNQHDCSATKDSSLTGDINATKRLQSKRADTQKKITSTLNAVTKVMRDNGYADGSYQFIYDGAPSLLANAPGRYKAKDGYFQSTFQESPGVPFHNRTVWWSNSVAVPMLNGMMRKAVEESDNKNITFLDLSRAFNGHEISNTSTKQYRDRNVTPEASDSEWVVPLDPHYIKNRKGSPRLQESFHPNAFGQRAIGQCVTQVLSAPSGSGDFSCVGVPGSATANASSVAK